MSWFSRFECPFCRWGFQRLEGARLPTLRSHLESDVACRLLPDGFSETDLEEFIVTLGKAQAETDLSQAPDKTPVVPTSSSVSLQCLVRTDDEHQVGRLIHVDNENATVQLFMGPGKDYERKIYPVKTLKRYELPRRTRVYIPSENSDRWQIGRITNPVPSEPFTTYAVGRSGLPPLDLLETQVEVPSKTVEVNPAEVLASGAVESQKVYEDRKAAIDSIYNYRARTRGMTGSLSSSIELLSHQINTVHRILSDPIQRYLLADEVGLGKTIEAGSVIRQILLDNSEEEIAIVVPVQLVQQWKKELRYKFHLDEFQGQWNIYSFEQVLDLESEDFTTLVVDEVHNLIRDAISDDGLSEVSDQLQLLLKLSARANRLLLLSATPVVAEDQATLVMLHILDPVSYPLDQIEQFNEKVSLRGEIGRLLLGLQADINPLLLKRTLYRMKDLIPEDGTIGQFAEVINELIDNQGDDTELTIEIGRLRRYVADSYRLSQRMLRTRRKDLAAGELISQTHIVKKQMITSQVLDRRIDGVIDWNERVVADTYNNTNTDSQGSLFARDQKMFKNLFEAIQCGDAAIAEVLNSQHSLDEELNSIKNEIRSTRRISATTRKAASFVKDYLDQLRSPDLNNPKVVAFTSSEMAARNFSEALKPLVGTEAAPLITRGMDEDDIEEQVLDFEESIEPCVLVCDGIGEEGLNLHFAHGIVHLDLPFSAARLQQRIGRLDRFGRRLDVIQHLVLLTSDFQDSLWSAWFELLRDGFKLFEQPVSDVQYILAELQGNLERILFLEGTNGLRLQIPIIRDRIAKERQSLDEQFALDVMIAQSDRFDQSDYVERSTDDSDDDRLAEDILRWSTRRIGLVRRTPSGFGDTQDEVFSLRLDDNAVQIPRAVAYSSLYEGLDKPYAINRLSALRNKSVKLFRPGSPLVDGIVNLIRRDERGSTFATWRTYPAMNKSQMDDLVALRLSYTVEADRNILNDELAGRVEDSMLNSVIRRADSYFSPFADIAHLGLDLDPGSIPDELEEVVRGDFDPKGDNQLYVDKNLVELQEILDSLVDPANMAFVCEQVIGDLTSILQRIPEFANRLESAKNQALDRLKIENQHLEQRKKLLGPNADSLASEIHINEVIANSITSPVANLESIGLIVVAGNLASARGQIQ